MRPEDRRLQRNRVTVLAVVTVAVFLMLLGRLWYLQVAMGGEFLRRSEQNWNKLLRARAARGSILDRKGRVLATSRPQFVVMAVPDELNRNRQALHTLCGILGISPADFDFAVRRSRPLPGSPARIAVDVDLDVVARIGELRMRLPGVSVELDQLRHYPNGPAVAHVMGSLGEISPEELEAAHKTGKDYRGGDYVGKSGLEKQYERELRGRDGGKRVKVNAEGRVVKILGEKPSLPGKTLKLTIDLDLQIAARRAMGDRVGAVVAVDPRTGAVLAMVSNPNYDPNVFVKRITVKDWQSIAQNRRKPLLNRCVLCAYPPGSTFKPIMAVAGLHFGVCNSHTTVSCPGVFHLGRAPFRCWKTHGSVDFRQAIAQSCDVWFYRMSRRLGIEHMAETARAFGIGSNTGIDLPAEEDGRMPDPEWKRRVLKEPWYPGNTINSVIGQGDVEATPLQMALACAAVAENGRLHRPYIVQQIVAPNGGLIRRTHPRVRSSFRASEGVFGLVQGGMREAVVGAHGTGRTCDIPDVPVAGKTGSAEVNGRAPHGWFICFAPVENPQIAVACIIEHGGHGSTSAAPVCRAVLDVFFGKRKPQEVGAAQASVVGD